MQSLLHKQHIRHNVSDMRCSECRADSERRFAGNHPFHYAYVHQYLEWVRPRLEAIRNGENSVDAQISGVTKGISMTDAELKLLDVECDVLLRRLADLKAAGRDSNSDVEYIETLYTLRDKTRERLGRSNA